MQIGTLTYSNLPHFFSLFFRGGLRVPSTHGGTLEGHLRGESMQGDNSPIPSSVFERVGARQPVRQLPGSHPEGIYLIYIQQLTYFQGRITFLPKKERGKPYAVATSCTPRHIKDSGHAADQ